MNSPCLKYRFLKIGYDYYPFGELMPGRTYNSTDFRYGFNGKEKDDELNGSTGTSYDYGMRIYDPRLGKFLGVDPLANRYPELTTYQYANNTPIQGIDLDGLEVILVNPAEDPGINKAGQNNNDDPANVIVLYAHGDANYIEGEHHHPIHDGYDLDKVLKEKSEAWRNRKKGGNII